MKKFSFKLDKLKKLRERNEEAALLELSLAQTNLAREEKILAELVTSVETSGRELHGLMAQGAPGETLRNADAYRRVSREAANRQEQALHDAQRVTDEAQREYQTARQRAEALRKLYEKHRNEHRKEWLHEMAQEMDEIGARRHGPIGSAR